MNYAEYPSLPHIRSTRHFHTGETPFEPSKCVSSTQILHFKCVDPIMPVDIIYNFYSRAWKTIVALFSIKDL